ncbi:alcohol dehydrogenase family protein [Motilimonas pumila]|nr:alcohol dehydrogenase family protein [Motilimonas pumila]
MAGVLLMGHGGPEMLQYQTDIKVPQPREHEVLVRVFAAGVNNTDINTRIGWYSKNDSSDDASWGGTSLPFPLVQGADVCGEVVAVGCKVDVNRLGQRVLIEPCITEVNGETMQPPWYFGSECNGGFAEYTVVAAKHAHRVESSFSDAELATFPCSYSTAENMLTRANVRHGEKVLITGASGGVGSGAIQLAKARGAQVIAVTSPAKQAQLLQLGADQVLNRHSDLVAALGENSVDVVIDLVAGKGWPQLLQVLRPHGRYAVSGAIGGPMVSLDVRTLYLKDLSFFGCTVLAPGVFANLITLIEQGKVKPLLASTFTLKDIHQAQQVFQQKEYIGKMVLQINSPS